MRAESGRLNESDWDDGRSGYQLLASNATISVMDRLWTIVLGLWSISVWYNSRLNLAAMIQLSERYGF